VPNAALDPAKVDSRAASCGTNSAKTGTPFFGYILAEAPVNTDFVDFFHNQTITAWPAFLNAAFRHASHTPHRHPRIATSAPSALAAF
jgi:hypothetical protein